MTARAQAPIADNRDRACIAYLANRIRPDWDTKGIESALAKHPDQSLDVLVVQALIAAMTRGDQRTPAVVGLDGDHTNRARAALSRPQVTPAPLTIAELGGDCAVCGVRQAMHRGARILSDDIGEHDWVAAPAFIAATPRPWAWAQEHATEGEQA
ncbi:MAG: hypothetical protein ACOH10_07905 [Rhodoglobus sp.]